MRGLYFCIRKRGDEKINVEKGHKKLSNFIRDLPALYLNAKPFIMNQKVLISFSEMTKNEPSYKGILGSMIKKDKEIFYVKTLDSYFKITGWQSNVKLKVGLRFHL